MCGFLHGAVADTLESEAARAERRLLRQHQVLYWWIVRDNHNGLVYCERCKEEQVANSFKGFSVVVSGEKFFKHTKTRRHKLSALPGDAERNKRAKEAWKRYRDDTVALTEQSIGASDTISLSGSESMASEVNKEGSAQPFMNEDGVSQEVAGTSGGAAADDLGDEVDTSTSPYNVQHQERLLNASLGFCK